MKRIAASGFVFFLMMVLGAGVPAWGYGPIAHGKISNRLMEDPDIAYAVGARKLSKPAITLVAQSADVTMPKSIKNIDWTSVSSADQMKKTWLTWTFSDTYAGWLMHVIGDVSVPTNHAPSGSWYKCGWAENLFEAQGEAYGMPGWPNPRSYVSNRSDYDGNANAFYNTMRSLAAKFKSHNGSHWSCKYFHVCQTDWIDGSCKQASLKLGWETFWFYLTKHP